MVPALVETCDGYLHSKRWKVSTALLQLWANQPSPFSQKKPLTKSPLANSIRPWQRTWSLHQAHIILHQSKSVRANKTSSLQSCNQKQTHLRATNLGLRVPPPHDWEESKRSSYVTKNFLVLASMSSLDLEVTAHFDSPFFSTITHKLSLPQRIPISFRPSDTLVVTILVDRSKPPIYGFRNPTLTK